MAALTASQILRSRERLLLNAEIRDASTVYFGSLAAMGSQTLTTAAQRGRLSPWTGVTGEIPWGYVTPGGDQTPTGGTMDRDGVLGDITPPTGEDVPSAPIHVGGDIIENVTVTGASSINLSTGRLVYIAVTDNPVVDLTLTRPTLGVPLGFIVRYRTGSLNDVYLFSVAELYLAGLAGSGQYTWHLGSIVPELAAAGDLLTGIEAPHHGLITSAYAICASAPADANMHMDIQLSIGGTLVTGGIMTLDFADTIALKLAGTAITALNIFSEGDLIDLEALASGLVAGTVMDGLYNIYAEIQPLPGA